jgi:hypothetical protein
MMKLGNSKLKNGSCHSVPNILFYRLFPKSLKNELHTYRPNAILRLYYFMDVKW